MIVLGLYCLRMSMPGFIETDSRIWVRVQNQGRKTARFQNFRNEYAYQYRIHIILGTGTRTSS